MTTTALLPKLRSDLIVTRRKTEEGASCVIKDREADSFFHLGEAEAFIAQQLDGYTALEAVRRRTEKQFDAELPPEILAAFVKNLESSHLLETGEGKRKPPGRRCRVSGSLLYLRFKAFDPGWLFDRLIGRVGFLFTPAFIMFSAVTIALGVATAALNWTEYRLEVPRLYHSSIIAPFILLSFLVVTAHEFGHGLTCRRFGGEVHEMGFMLIYLQPALYCNVSEAWLFPEKSKRLWVGFAGPYFELFLWGLATLAWRITDSRSWINLPALIVMTASGIKTLINFNPLIKLDGYYLLSDYLEIPNLRQKSFRYVGSLVGRLLGSGPSRTEDLTPRERWVFLVYGLIATVSSFVLLAYVFLRVLGLLVVSHQPAAFVVSAVLLGSRLRSRLSRLFGGKADPADLDDGMDYESDAAAAPPARLDEAAVAIPRTAEAAVAIARTEEAPPQRRPRKRGRWRRRIFFTLAAATAAVMAVAIQRGRMELRVSGPFTVVPRESAEVRAAVEGIIDRIYVDEGDRVKRGQLIARLSDKDLRAELDKIEAEIKETGARLRMLQAGPTTYELEVAKAVVTKAGDEVKYTQDRLARASDLYQEHLRSRNMYEDAKADANSAQDELLEAKSRLNVLLSGNRPEQIEAAQAEMERLNGESAHLKYQVQQLAILSPAAGIVVTPSLQLKEMLHVLVKKGDPILKVADTTAVTAQILIPEGEVDAISTGRRVLLRTRAYPDHEFEGTVRSIATSAVDVAGNGMSAAAATVEPPGGSGNANRTFIVATQIQNDGMLLKSEMTGQAKIYCGERRIIELMKRRLERTFKVEFWTWF